MAPSLCTSSSSPCSHSARSQSRVAPSSGEFQLPSWKAHRKSLDQNNCLFLSFFFSPSRDFYPLWSLFYAKDSSKSFLDRLYIIYCVQIFSYPRFRSVLACFDWYAATTRPTYCSGLNWLCLQRRWKSQEKNWKNFLRGRYDFFKFWKYFLFLFFWGGWGRDKSKMACNWIRTEFIFRIKFNKIYNSS